MERMQKLLGRHTGKAALKPGPKQVMLTGITDAGTREK